MPKRILITGASGFIGKGLCERFAPHHDLVGCYHRSIVPQKSYTCRQVDLTKKTDVEFLCNDFFPDVIIHCAGLAHQKRAHVSADEYFRINSLATENLAAVSAKINPKVNFIYCSSISVYGESEHGVIFNEASVLSPTSDYARSKIDAEKRLLKLFDNRILNHVTVLRLAPVYSKEWSLNLDRRVLCPGNIAYIRFGSGTQRMSALALGNLCDFMFHTIHTNTLSRSFHILNTCDKHPYSFRNIIDIFKQSTVKPDGPVLKVPLIFLKIGLVCGSILLRNQKEWFQSSYRKIAFDIVVDNRKMYRNGFRQKESLHTVFQLL